MTAGGRLDGVETQARRLLADSANLHPLAAANAHINGQTHALIGASRQSDAVAGGPSIDQFIAQHLTGTLLPSLELFVSSDSWPYEATGDEACLDLRQARR